MRTIIGLTGAKGAGKTTAFGMLRELIKGEVREITLANRLKNASSTALEIPRGDFDHPRMKEKDLEIPVCLTAEQISAIIHHFGVQPDFDKHIRPHIGKTLHTPRQIAQYVGTEVLRNVDGQIHCKGAILGLPDIGTFVVTDMRFWNEYHFFAENPEVRFIPVYIANSCAEAKAALDFHISEKYVLDIAKKCRRIDNNGTLRELQIQLKDLICSEGL